MKLKITKIFGMVILVVFLVGISALASRDVTFASESDSSRSEEYSVQGISRDSENEHDDIFASGEEDDNESGEDNRAVAGYRGEREDDDEDREESGDDRNEVRRSRTGRSPGTPGPMTPPAVTPAPTPAPSVNATVVSYARVIQPILNNRCNSCHPTGGVNLSTYAGTRAAVRQLPGMGGGYLSAAELQSLLNWIKQGALNN